MAGSWSFGLLLLGVWLRGCWAVWRYKTNTGDYFIFSTRTTIYLEYEGTDFLEWSVSSLCVISDKNSPETTLTCPVPGTHRIIPIVKTSSAVGMERILSVIADVNCFMWYIYQDTKRLTQENPKQFIKIWIFDPENADESELNYTAASPSIYSKTLSKQFWNLGETPLVKTVSRGREYYEKEFNDGIWTIEVPTLTNDNIGEIYGKTLTFQDCFVRATPFVIAQPAFHLGFQTDISISSQPGSRPIVAWDACHPATAALVTDFGTFYTNDGFLTTEEIKFPAHIIDHTLVNSVTKVAIMFPDVFILIQDKLYKATEDDTYNIGDTYNIPDTGVKGLRTKTWCSNEYPLMDILLSEVIIWTDEELFLGFPGDEYRPLTDAWLLREQLNLKRTNNLLIISACYDSLAGLIAVLIECTGCTSATILLLATYDEGTNKWKLRDFSQTSSPTGEIQMEVMASALTSMVMWDDDTIYYTYKENKDYGFLHVSGTDKLLSAKSEGTSIHQIIIDFNGNTIIKMDNNVIYFFKFEMTDAVKLVPWEDETTDFIFYCNPSGNMYLLTVVGRVIKRQVYPLKLEAFSAASQLNEVCPYISFEHSMNKDVYYVDMGERLTFWSQLVFQENLGLFTEVEVYKSELLHQESSLHYEIARGICTKNDTITFYHKKDYSQLHDYRATIKTAQGVMTVELHPSSSGKTCDLAVKLSHIRVGCPPGKRLHVMGKPSQCDSFNFTVPWKALRNETVTEDLEINYDVEKYGCPIEVHYANSFRPTIALYMDDQFSNIVEANYIVWEMNGRNDFAYNATMEQVHCLQTAQSWISMADRYNNNESLSITAEEADTIWGPHNYVSCFETIFEDLSDLDNPYEILNHSGINSITWSEYQTGIYMFRLKIVDPNFSFCSLSALFAVRTKGIIERPNWLLVVAWSTMLVTLFLGVLVFSYFRYVKKFRTLNFVDPLLKLGVRRSRDGLKKD